MDEPLDTILAEIHNQLSYGATHRRSSMHTPVVGTADGNLRVMVLRDFDRATKTLRFHTDARSPKVSAIQRDPAATVLFYDPEQKVQIRAKGVCRVEHAGAVADAAWEESTPFARRCYLAEFDPGAQSDLPVSGLPEWAEGLTPTPAQVAAGRPNFAVLLVKICTLDWLYLANTGHRRARFDLSDGQATSVWLVP